MPRGLPESGGGVKTVLRWIAAFSALSVSTISSGTPNTYGVALGICLESYSYPFDVHQLTLTIEEQKVEMAYMDVPPTYKSHPSGKTVLLLHGKNFSSDYWEPTIRALTEAGYRVIVPDQIGFNKSAKPDIHYSFDLLASDTMELLKQLGITKVSVVGHGMGGMLAIRFARTYPKTVEKLVLEDSSGLENVRLRELPPSLDQLVGEEMSLTEDDAIRKRFKQYFARWLDYDDERFVEIRARIALSNEFRRWAKVAALTTLMIDQQPVAQELALLEPPTLLVQGELDHQVPPELGEAAAKVIRGSKLVRIGGVAHVPHMEKSARFNSELLKFLAS